MTAIVVLSMVFTPLMIIVSQKFIVPRLQKIDEIKPHDHIEEQNPIILVGLGRFGQVVNHLLQMTGYHPTIIELDPKLIAGMKKRGVKSYYGNGAHPDLLKAAGIQTAQMLIVAIDNPKQTLEIVKYARSVNPHIKIIARAYDRYHVYDLVQSGADIEVRETFDGALRTGKQALRELGLDADKVHEIGNMYFGKDRHSVKLMSEVYDPKSNVLKTKKCIVSLSNKIKKLWRKSRRFGERVTLSKRLNFAKSLRILTACFAISNLKITGKICNTTKFDVKTER
ncbi:glutathione-regulated potassium-efflux system protein [Actinobacillus equuli]|nr:glutathione-regulated potassium-efflux system protein [Actinobacillus equuli]